MTSPPTPQHVPIDALEMEQLIEHHQFYDKIHGCRVQPVVDENVSEAKLMHEAFCCKKTILKVLDAATDDEVATINHYVDNNGVESHKVVSLRIDSTVYRLKLR